MPRFFPPWRYLPDPSPWYMFIVCCVCLLQGRLTVPGSNKIHSKCAWAKKMNHDRPIYPPWGCMSCIMKIVLDHNELLRAMIWDECRLDQAELYLAAHFTTKSEGFLMHHLEVIAVFVIGHFSLSIEDTFHACRVACSQPLVVWMMSACFKSGSRKGLILFRD